jgi:asparagine synthase (glutamine-hydrolysing)
MLSLLSHRAPDGTSSWSGGSVALGSGFLRTAPAAAARTIHRSDGDRFVVAADARIDNRRELVDRLDSGRPPDVVSEEELILLAYRAWGSEAPRHLIGDFAFAIWDRDRRTLFCARDPIGTRPFHYYLSDRLFAFASEIKALLCLSEVPRDLDEVQVAYFLDGFIDDPERTYYRHVRRLPAAHVLEVSPDGMKLDRYWRPDPGREIHFGSDDQYAEAFREIFLEAVRCRLRDADPVGAALSGGLDSSSVVRGARLLLPREQPLHTFSAVFPGLPEAERREGDESEYIDAVVDAEGIVSHRVAVDRVPPLAEYDRAMWHIDSPPLAFNLYMHWGLFAAARREGVHVFLDGTDGDSVVSKGFERFVDLANEGRWAEMVRETNALTSRHESIRSWFPTYLVYPQLLRLARQGRWVNWWRGSGEVARGFRRSRGRLLLRYGLAAFAPPRLMVRYLDWKNGWRSWKPLTRKDFTERVELRERKRALLPGDWAASAREDHARVLSLPRYQFAVELIGGLGTIFGIDVRYPFFDRRLIEFCIAIPPEQKLADGWTRLIQRRAMEEILPTSVQWRMTKGNLGFNFARNLREFEAGGFHEVLFGDPSLLEDYVDMDVLRSMHDRFLATDPGADFAASNSDAMDLYKAVVLARWLRDHGPGRS